VLANLDPDQELPDPIYLASLDHAVTPEEVAFRDVLVFHRDCLNGGLDQAIFNLQNTGQPLDPVVEAYRSVGLSAVATLLDEAAVAWRRGGDLDELTERYIQFTYGENNDQPDAVEGTAVRYAQLHETAFAGVIAAAERGEFKKFDFG
jgi:hypothetical protein